MKPEKASLHIFAFSDEAAPVFISLRRGKPFHSAIMRKLKMRVFSRRTQKQHKIP
jgi:hypothetical protein